LLCPLRLYSRSEESNHGHRRVLRVSYGRPCHDGAAEKCDEIAPPHRLLRGSRLGVVPAQSSTSKAGRTRVRGAARHVRFGSKADIGLSPVDVRYSPKSGHRHVGNARVVLMSDIVAQCLHSKGGCFLLRYAVPSSANSSNSRLATHSGLNDPM
jgi:hypothetical protein